MFPFDLCLTALAILCTPLTIWVLARRDERAFRQLMEAQAVSIDRVLSHAASTQAPGEPAGVTAARLAVEEKKVAAAIEATRLRAGAGFDPLSD